MINIYNRDNLEAMREMEDNQYDLAIVDPPYGITKGMTAGKRGLEGIPGKNKRKEIYDLGDADWNIAPSDEYFKELLRVSKNQIVWGGNYFPQLWSQPSRGYIVWDKRQISKLHADCEMAWTSFDRNAKIFKYRWCGNKVEYGNGSKIDRFHPTQKPISLYSWILRNYSKPGQRILDTHLGSGAIAIAADDFGVSLDGYEINETYYTKALERLDTHRRQYKLFDLTGM